MSECDERVSVGAQRVVGRLPLDTRGRGPRLVLLRDACHLLHEHRELCVRHVRTHPPEPRRDFRSELLPPLSADGHLWRSEERAAQDSPASLCLLTCTKLLPTLLKLVEEEPPAAVRLGSPKLCLDSI